MYAKLFSRITESSIIEESITTRWVFVALLAIADPDGTVIGTDIAIARRINVQMEDFEASMKVLMAPDPHSNNLEFDGIRVLPSKSERGYFLTGYARYRALKNEEDRRDYMKNYMRERRSKEDAVNSVNIPLTKLTHAEADTKTEENEDAKKILSHLNQKAGTNYRNVSSNLKFIDSRLKESSVDDCLKVIDIKCNEWGKKPDMKKYLRPETLFNATKFHGYLGQVDGITTQPMVSRSLSSTLESQGLK